MPDVQKTEKMMSPLEAAQFLRSLADHLERGQMDFGEVLVDLDSPFKVKQAVKAKSDRISFKLKLKYEKVLTPVGGALGSGHPLLENDDDDDDDEEETAPAKASYKKLKKAMSGSFKQIRQELQAGHLPALETVRQFHGQCLAMTEYPGKGEDFYAVFRESADRLLAGVERADLTLAQEAVAQLEARRKSCHGQYK